MRHSARSEETLATPVHQSVTDEDLYEALRGYWHPVAYVSELADGGPLPLTLLDEPLVLARIDGAVSAFRDICVHRGTALSLGSSTRAGSAAATTAGPTTQRAAAPRSPPVRICRSRRGPA